MFYYENKLKKKGYKVIIGIDEAGRGPLAGPVVAAAVALKTSRFKNRIDDSKKLTAPQREKAFLEIEGKALSGIGIISESIIDRLNILQATRIAMDHALLDLLNKLKIRRRQNIHVIVDGNLKLETLLPVTNIIRGDSKSKSIACASIMAKVTRDRIMNIYDKIYPQYGFIRHKGYPTRIHRSALAKFGPTAIHRRSFRHVQA